MTAQGIVAMSSACLVMQEPQPMTARGAPGTIARDGTGILAQTFDSHMYAANKVTVFHHIHHDTFTAPR